VPLRYKHRNSREKGIKSTFDLFFAPDQNGFEKSSNAKVMEYLDQLIIKSRNKGHTTAQMASKRVQMQGAANPEE